MADVKRARAEASPWLLPPIVLQVVHCLDATAHVLAFLQAVPSSARDEALNALATLLTDDADLWPVAAVANLNGMDVATVTRALPAFRQLALDRRSDVSNRCRSTLLPLTTAVHATVHYPFDLQSSLGHWARNLVSLAIVEEEVPVDVQVLEHEIAACKDLRSFSMNFRELNQETLDGVMAAITALCPNLCKLRLDGLPTTPLESCECLRQWLAQSSAQQFYLFDISWTPAAATSLASALLATPTLRSIGLANAVSVLRPFLALSHASPPRQLRNLTILDLSSFNNSALPSPLETLAQSFLHPSHAHQLRTLTIYTFDSWGHTALPTTLRTFKLSSSSLERVPFQLPELEHLELSVESMHGDAVTDLTTLLATTTTLHRLDIVNCSFDNGQLETILLALPTWLNRQRTTCCLQLDASAAALLTVAMAALRNTHDVHITLRSSDGLDLSVCQRLVTALGATSRIQLCFQRRRRNNPINLDAHAQAHHVRRIGTWFASPVQSTSLYIL